MTRLSWIKKRQHDKRNGSKRFLPRNTNGNGDILIALNFQTSLPAGHVSVNACSRELLPRPW